MQKIRNWTAALLFVTTLGGATLTLATPQTTFAACNDRLLTFPAWFKGLTDGNCDIKSPSAVGGISTFIWTIVLNIIEMMLQLTGYVSVGFIIRAGFKYFTAIGASGEIEKAKLMLKNAIVGLILSLFSVAIVSFVAGAVK